MQAVLDLALGTPRSSRSIIARTSPRVASGRSDWIVEEYLAAALAVELLGDDRRFGPAPSCAEAKARLTVASDIDPGDPARLRESLRLLIREHAHAFGLATATGDAEAARLAGRLYFPAQLDRGFRARAMRAAEDLRETVRTRR